MVCFLYVRCQIWKVNFHGIQHHRRKRKKEREREREREREVFALSILHEFLSRSARKTEQITGRYRDVNISKL